MKKIISRCPVCNHELTVARLKCDSCDTVIENSFKLSKFDYLSDEELYFTETFIRCRGNIKEVEKELGISYPTVRSKLDSIIKKLGYESGPDEQTLKRDEILKALYLSTRYHWYVCRRNNIPVDKLDSINYQ